mmetsp:Transcript_12065/g.17324  ORF Transcript_12065/g.17324 Transcript_12065/m.17324 type:complete len:572 (+) Transcript_12065:75-1790(+)
MVNVMEFLPPRSLYNIALTCKSLREMVTTKMVVQSALIHGGHAKKTMEELYALMRNHSIHVPSPLRLLRLANGKRCEFCFLSGTNHVRPGLGVFACWDCVASGRGRFNSGLGVTVLDTSEKLTRAWKTSWARYNRKPIYRTILSYPRVASNGYSTNHYFWKENRSDACGERVGPLVTWGDVDALCGYYDQLKAAAVAKEAAEAAAADTDDKEDGDDQEEKEEEEAPPSLNNGEWIDYYLTKNLNAPPKEEYVEFNHTFTNTVEMAKRISREREVLKKSKRDDKMQIKVAKVEKMLDDLKALIDEPFRELAIKTYGKERYLQNGRSTEQCLFLETPFIDSWLKPYIKSPSKMNKKVMKEMAEKINVELHRIEKLLEMDFLSDDDDFEAAAKSYLRECFPNVEALYSCVGGSPSHKCNLMDDEFLVLIQNDRFFGALSYLKRNDLSPILLVTEPSASLVQASTNLEESSLKMLAKKAWLHKRVSKDTEDDSWLAGAFATGHEYFGAVMTKIDNFVLWLEAEGKLDEDTRETFLNEYVQYYTSSFSWYFDNFMKTEDFAKIWEWAEKYIVPRLP